LAHLGWLPELEDEAPVVTTGNTSADCSNCSGCGVVVYRSFEERCPSCGGSGVRPTSPAALRPHGRPIVELVATAA